jgi:hypothetical protein
MAPLLQTEAAVLDYGDGVELPAAELTFAVPHGPPAVVPAR